MLAHAHIRADSPKIPGAITSRPGSNTASENPVQIWKFIMHGAGERPRELRWYHAAGMLFGDWGTSRLYVLGLAFYMSGHASFWYVAAMCGLVTLVGFAYTIICQHFPDGGGVYSAAKHRSKSLAVIGALLLIADYIVTASISSYDGFRYILSDFPKEYALYAAIAAISAIGCMNVFGPRRVGQIALVVAIISAIFYAIVAIFCVAGSGPAVITAPHESFAHQWEHFVNVILALSGVEAIANMTGVMSEPVAKNARKAIIVVLLEVVTLNLVMAWAMNAAGEQLRAYSPDDQRDYMVKILATIYGGKWLAGISSLFFGMLLLSAANTAIGDMVSIQYLMARDKELPLIFTKLNSYGMPWVGLVTATIVPIVVLIITGSDTEVLAGLYAIGVIGAIAINLLACGTNLKLELKRWERIALLLVGLVIVAIETSIAFDKHKALIFATSVLSLGLVARLGAKREWKRMYVGAAGFGIAAAALMFIHDETTKSLVYASLAAAMIGFAHYVPLQAPVVEAPKEVARPKRLTDTAIIRATFTPNMPRLLVPTRGNPKLFNFAVGYAKDKKAGLLVLFVREVALTFRERGGQVAAEGMTLANDREAQAIFAQAQNKCDQAGVPMIPVYVVHDSAAEMILDYAAMHGVDAVLMGVSQRGSLWKTLKGDVLQEVIEYLPESIPLLVHA